VRVGEGGDRIRDAGVGVDGQNGSAHELGNLHDDLEVSDARTSTSPTERRVNAR
jgi:hypothetical protein